MSYEPREVFKDQGANMEDSVECRMRGKQAFQDGDYDEAIRQYDEAIELDELYATPTELATLYSNRAACWAQRGEHAKSLADAEKCIEIDPKFTKGYNRKGHALFYLQRLDDAEQAFAEGVKLDETNEICKRGLADCQELQEKLFKRSIKGKAMKFAGRITGSFEFAKDMSQKIHVDRSVLIGIILCVSCLVVGGFCLYKLKLQKPSSRSISDASTKVLRRFKKLDGIWLSHLEAGVSTNLKLLMLHQTSLSAEAEFGGIIPQLVGKAAPPGGIKVVAPDRPCHGFSLCPARGEPREAGVTLFARILSERPVAQKFAYMASGHEAARHTLEIVQRRRQPARLIFIRPQMRSLAADGLTSPLAIGETVRWELLTGANHSAEQGELEPLIVREMPKGCAVMLIYHKGDTEDPSLRSAFEASDAGISVTTRYIESSGDGLATAALLMLGGRSLAAAEEETSSAPDQPMEDEIDLGASGAASIGLMSRLPKAASGASSWLAAMFRGNPEMEEW